MPSPAASVATRKVTSGVDGKRLLAVLAVLALGAAVDDDDRIIPAQVVAQPLGQIVQRVLVLGEDDDLAALA